MKLIELGDDKEAATRWTMLRTVAFEGLAPQDEKLSRRLKKIQERLAESQEEPPLSLVLDEEWVELLKARVFGAGIQWNARVNTQALDIFDVLKAALAAEDFKPELVKKENSAA